MSGAASSSSSSKLNSPAPYTQSTFAPEMRARQARGHPHEGEEDNDDDENDDWVLDQHIRTDNNARKSSSKDVAAAPRRAAPRPIRTIQDSTFTANERRRMASQVLNNSELLAMAAVRDSETIPGMRLRYTRLMCGLEEPPITNTTKTTTTTTTTQTTRPSSASGTATGTESPKDKRPRRKQGVSFQIS
ncbi:hypothetical protein F5Y17DRAFT_436041 [Xylariaceae sp. FL0594]|nr:hypothetical protein F5Y17DRAFT_436041 [Xylariaceae sp. FL0594]